MPRPGSRRTLACLLALVCSTLLGCAANPRPPTGRLLAAFEAFAPRPMGKVGRDTWIGDVSTDQSQAATTITSTADPGSTGPLVARVAESHLANEGRRGSYLLRFDGALCPTSIGEVTVPEQAITVERKTASGWSSVEGRTWWRSDRLVAFEAGEAWHAATRYRITGPEVPCEGARIDGEAGTSGRWHRSEVHLPLTAHFEGTPDSRLDANAPLVVTTSHPVEIDALRNATTIQFSHRDAPDGPRTTLAFDITVPDDQRDRHGAPHRFELRPATRDGVWPAGVDLHARLAPTLRSAVGPEPLESPVQITRGIAKPLAFWPTCANHCEPGTAMEVLSTRALKADQLKRIRVSPRPPGLEISTHRRGARDADQADGTLVVDGLFAPDRSYTITLPRGLADVEGTTLGAETKVKFHTGEVDPIFGFDRDDLYPYRDFDDDDAGATTSVVPTWNESWTDVRTPYWELTILEAGRPMTVGVVGRRIERYEVKVAAIEPARLPTWLSVSDLLAVPWPADAEVARASRSLRPHGPTEYDSQALDLGALVGDRRGVFVVEITATSVRGADPSVIEQPDRMLVMLTGLSPTVAESTTRRTVRVRRLGSDAPVANARVKLVVPQEVFGEPDAEAKRGRHPRVELVELGSTDARGELALRASPSNLRTAPFLVVDAPNADRAILELPPSPADPTLDDGVTRLGESIVGKLATERGIYRPGETMHLLGWSSISSPWTELRSRPMPEGTTVRINVKHERLGDIAFEDVKTGPHGKFTADIALPADLGAGGLELTASVIGGRGRISGQNARVEDFRTPTFWVRSTAKGRKGPADLEGEIVARANAYSGGPVPVIDIAFSHDCSFTRPNPRDYGLDYDWSVGSPRAGEGSNLLSLDLPDPPSIVEPAIDGEVRLHARFEPLPPATHLSCTVDTALTDTSLQAYGDQAWFDRAGEGTVAALHVDDGEAWSRRGRHPVRIRTVALGGDRVAVQKVELTVRARHYGGTATPTEIPPCLVDVGAEGKDATCELPPLEPGGYTLVATTPDGIRTERDIYADSWDAGAKALPVEAEPEPIEQCEKVAGGESCHYVHPDVGFSSPNRPVNLSLHPAVDYVRVGDRLSVAVRGPWNGATGTLLVGEGGHLGRHDFTLRRGRADIELLVDERWVGGVAFTAWLPRRNEIRLPVLETAQADVEVSEASRTLAVKFDVASKARAGESLPIALRVTDRDGAPARKGRVSLWMVDEAVLDLTSYRAPRLDYVLSPRGEDGSDTHAFDPLVTKPYQPRKRDPGTGLGLIGMGAGGGGYGSGSGAGFGGRGRRAAESERITRDRFATTPLFLADVALDDDGRAEEKVDLPGNLTRFRLMAVATAALPEAATPQVAASEAGVLEAVPSSYGTDATTVTVDLPLSVRLALPRHLRPGDRARLGAIVVNREDRPRKVTIDLGIDEGPLTLEGATSHTVEVPAQGRARVDFDAIAGQDGTSSLRARVFDPTAPGDPIDAEVRPLEIRHERLREHEDAFSGALRGPTRGNRVVKIPIDLPPQLDPEAVEVNLALSTSRLLDLGPGLAALARYPYGCTEQTASAMLPGIAAQGPRLRALYPDAGREDFVKAGILKLAARQKTDGSFGYWSASSSTYDWASLHATWVLAQADAAGFDVPDEVLERALAHAKAVATKPPEPDEWDWEREVRRFAAWVLTDAGAIGDSSAASEDTAAILAVLREHATSASDSSAVTVEERALITYALHRAETSSGQAPSQATIDGLVAQLRRDVTISNGRAFVHPESVDVGLGDTFRSTTRATALVLIALLQVEGEDPLVDMLARGLLEQRFAGSWGTTQANAFALVALDRWATARESAPVRLETELWLTQRKILAQTLEGPSTEVVRASGPLRIADEKGRNALIVRVSGSGQMYFEAALKRLRAVDERPEDRGLHLEAALRDAKGPVAGQARAGDLLALDVVVTTDTATRFVVADVPLPAGLELVRTDLGNQMRQMPIEGERGDWVSHVEPGADRVVIYGDDLAPGEHRTTVFVRATAEGRYRWPGGRAQAMYDPAVEGWAPTRSFVVTQRD